MQEYIRAVLFILILTMFLGGGTLMSSEIQNHVSSPGHFSSPEEAVQIITELLKKRDFKTLASYYDLSDSGIKLADLESGDFFIRKKRPEVAHPAELWHYKHPFSPGFKYISMDSGPRENIYTIRVEIIIDQGTSSPSQIGRDSFYMIKSPKGWKILTDHVASKEGGELPLLAPEPMPDPSWK